jgi:hypothetical protein
MFISGRASDGTLNLITLTQPLDMLGPCAHVQAPFGLLTIRLAQGYFAVKRLKENLCIGRILPLKKRDYGKRFKHAFMDNGKPIGKP